MPETLNPQEERHLIGCVKQAVALVSDGLAPDAAIEKIARQERLTPGQIATVAHAYNTGQQLNQWQEGKNVLDKLAAFPLADPAAVTGAVYGTTPPAEKAAGVDLDYFLPPAEIRVAGPGREKVARAEPPPPPEVGPERRLTLALGVRDREKRAVAELGRRASAAEDALRARLADLVGHLKTASPRVPFAAVEHAAETYFGVRVRPLMDLTHARLHSREKRAANVAWDDPGFSKVAFAVDLSRPPYSLIAACIKAAEDVALARQALEAGRVKQAAATEEALRPFAAAQEPKQAAATDSVWSEKAAGILGTPAVGAFLGSMISRGTGVAGVPKSKDELVEDAWLDLEDPAHANELRKIRAHTMLNQLMTDPEDPISGHDPDRVLRAYNEISQGFPRLAENMATLRPILRKRLEGHPEPFEAKEMTDIEKGLRDTKTPTPNTSLLSDGPEKLLG
jgi:hypothetical protein